MSDRIIEIGTPMGRKHFFDSKPSLESLQRILASDMHQSIKDAAFRLLPAALKAKYEGEEE